jgi:dienelactone hydrolase
MRRAIAGVVLMSGAVGGVATFGLGAQAAPTTPERDWIKIALAVTDEIHAQDWAKVTARFDATMRAALSADKLAEVWAATLAMFGPFRRVEKTALTDAAGYHVVVVTCAHEKGGVDVKVALDSDGKLAGLFILPAASLVPWEPPAYGRAPVDERAVTVGPAKLPGKLTLPHGTSASAGPWPAVVLVHGSGPQDEDETIGPSKVFRDLALGLAAHGIATLRYVKRTKHDPGAFAPANRYTLKEEALDDARAAVALLAATPSVDGKRIFVAGHSLGGYLAPRIADGDAHVAGIVILAGSTRPLEDILIEQMKYLTRNQPGPSAAVASAEAAARAIRDPKLTDAAVVDFAGSKLPGSYFLDMRRYDPAAVAARLNIPILVLQGERDFQVRRADYDGWARALHGRANATLKLYPTLNHLFETGTGEPDPGEYMAPGQHVAEQVVRDIATFVAAPARAPGSKPR